MQVHPEKSHRINTPRKNLPGISRFAEMCMKINGSYVIDGAAWMDILKKKGVIRVFLRALLGGGLR